MHIKHIKYYVEKILQYFLEQLINLPILNIHNNSLFSPKIEWV